MERRFGPKRKNVTEVWTELLKKFYNFHSSPNTIRMIISRRVKWAQYVACMEQMRNACRTLVGEPKSFRMEETTSKTKAEMEKL